MFSFKTQKERIGRAKSSENLTYCVSSFYTFYYSPLEEEGCGLRKSSLFFSNIYLCYILKKTLITLYCFIQHVACDACFKSKSESLFSTVIFLGK